MPSTCGAVMCLHIGLRSLIQQANRAWWSACNAAVFLSVFRLLLDIGLPAPRLKPVVRKADLGAGETSAVGGVGLDGLKQVLRRDPFLHGLFDLGQASGFAAQSIRRIGSQNLLSLPRLALARRRFFLQVQW